MYDYGYVEAIFFKKDILLFQKLLNKICKAGDFYPPKGDVTHKLHLTFLYGIVEDKLDKSQIDKSIKSIKLDKLSLGKLKLMNLTRPNSQGFVTIKGYKDFQILYVEVLDEKGELNQIHRDLKGFPFEPSVQNPEFIPHIALAYVKPGFELKNEIDVDIPSELKIKSIKYLGMKNKCKTYLFKFPKIIYNKFYLC